MKAKIGFTCSDYFQKQESNEQFKSTHTKESYLLSEKTKQQTNKNSTTSASTSARTFYNYHKPSYLVDNLKQMECLIGELKVNVVDNMQNEITRLNKVKSELENSVDMLTNRLKIKNEQLTGISSINSVIAKENNLTEQTNERVESEMKHMSIALPMTKKKKNK